MNLWIITFCRNKLQNYTNRCKGKQSKAYKQIITNISKLERVTGLLRYSFIHFARSLRLPAYFRLPLARSQTRFCVFASHYHANTQKAPQGCSLIIGAPNYSENTIKLSININLLNPNIACIFFVTG